MFQFSFSTMNQIIVIIFLILAIMFFHSLCNTSLWLDILYIVLANSNIITTLFLQTILSFLKINLMIFKIIILLIILSHYAKVCLILNSVYLIELSNAHTLLQYCVYF